MFDFFPGQKSRNRRCKEGQHGGLTCSELLSQPQESDLLVNRDQVFCDHINGRIYEATPDETGRN